MLQLEKCASHLDFKLLLSIYKDPDETINGKRCELPFKYNGVMYYGCTPYNGDTGDFWCSTKVGEGREYIGQWNYCKIGLLINPCIV